LKDKNVKIYHRLYTRSLSDNIEPYGKDRLRIHVFYVWFSYVLVHT